MATLQKIRNRGGVLVSIVIGLPSWRLLLVMLLALAPALSIVPETKLEKLEVKLSAFKNINKRL